MEIEIPCDLYSRLAEVAITLDAADPRQYLKSLFIERRNNRLFAVATNARCGAIEHLGVNSGPDEHTAIIIEPNLLKACEHEAQHGGTMKINANDLLRFTTISTTYGGQLTWNPFVALPDENWLVRWREWLPKEMPTQSFGTMYWGMQSIYALSCASKSGGLKFPQHIDVRQPVIVNDTDSSDWIGVFMPTQKGTEHMSPVIIPDWI